MNLDCHAVFPSRPSGMSVAEYDSHVQRGHCSRLLRGECSRPCEDVSEDGSYHVDFDHIVPKAKGGEDSGWNLEPKCRGYNQWVKRADHDEEFDRVFHFDQPINTMMLRANQYTHGYDLVKTAYRDLFRLPSKEIQNCYMLLAWMVGTGKSIGMNAILHAINEVINDEGPARPRIRKVLWLVHQETLVRSIRDEVQSEPTQYGIIQVEPTTAIVEKAEDWNVAITQADIVFACTQSLWSRKGSALTAEDRARYLSNFDAIVIDECHYGIEKYMEILGAAPRALKFVMSATPHDANGTFLSRIEDGRYRHLFRLFSAFGYESAYREKLVKKVPEWNEGIKSLRYIPVAGGESYFVEGGQIVSGETNTCNRYNSPRVSAIIKTAVEAAENIKEYPSHVMVRCEAISKLKSLEKSIKSEPTEYFPSANGWGVESIYSGSSGIKINNPNHPWMLVKKGEKVVPSSKNRPGSSRLLLTVNMGQFGLNNPYCSVVAWTDPNMSIVELVQRIGRAVRLVRNVPHEKQSITLVFADDPKLKERLEKAVDYMINMESEIYASFVSLGDSIEAPQELLPPMTQDPKIDQELFSIIHEHHGLALPDGLSPDDIREIVDAVDTDDENKDALFERISNYIEKLGSEEYKDKQFGLPDAAQPLAFVFNEKCKESFTSQEMELFVRSHYSPETVPYILSDLADEREATVKMLTEEMKRKYSRFHRPPGKYFSVQSLLGIVKGSRVSELPHETYTYYGRLKTSFSFLLKASTPKEIGRIRSILSSSLNVACSQAFGLKDFQKSTYAEFEAQLSSTLCSPMVAHKIISRAKARAIHRLKEQMPGHHKLYLQQLLQFGVDQDNTIDGGATDA